MTLDQSTIDGLLKASSIKREEALIIIRLRASVTAGFYLDPLAGCNHSVFRMFLVASLINYIGTKLY